MIEHFFRAYLVAYNFWLGITLGSLVILMLQYLTGGIWGILLRPTLESATRTMPLMILLFIPIALALSRIFPWAEGAVTGRSELGNRTYLNDSFFLIRAAVYFFVWLVLSGLLGRWWAGHAGDDVPRRVRLASAYGLVLYSVTITFAAIDWVMSLEPTWYSTIFPPLFAVGQILGGMAFALVAVLTLPHAARAGSPDPNRMRDLGNLLLTFVMAWAYLSFSQFLLIWSENIPDESSWYLLRTRSSWQWIAMAVAVLGFAVPFLLLLSRDVKENAGRLRAVAGLVLVMRFVDLVWWIEAAYPGGVGFYWLMDVAVVAALGAIWVWWFLGDLRRRQAQGVVRESAYE
jgi:hypothetical protein